VKVCVQQALFKPRGGKRRGAGRPSLRARPGVPHRARAILKARFPVHVVVRVDGAVGSLRRRGIYHAIRLATVKAAKRTDFRIAQLSVQRTHIHLLVEADSKQALARGMQGFQISAAKHINAAVAESSRRRGRVFTDRYHATIITTPKQARHVLAYVLGNWRKHEEDRDARVGRWRIDWFSSAPEFKHWKERGDLPALWSSPASYQPLRVLPAKTWLLREGWKLHGGTLSCFDVPSHA
jgi:REP element-mobilizing transposase RayT